MRKGLRGRRRVGPVCDYAGQRTGVNKGAIRTFGLLAAISCAPALALDDIPKTSGFSGFILVAPGVFNVQSNLIVEGPPLLDDVGNVRIESIFDPPS